MPSEVLTWLLLLSTGVPLYWAWRAARHTSLRHTMLWLGFAWLAWLGAAGYELILPELERAGPWGELLSHLPPPLLTVNVSVPRYAALCLTACAFIAVLGARQPGMGAWNFVVTALAAVLALPLLEQRWDDPDWRLDAPRSIFLGLILLMGVINYVPTQLGPAAAVAGLALGIQLSALAWPELRRFEIRGMLVRSPFPLALSLAMSVWVAWLVLGRQLRALAWLGQLLGREEPTTAFRALWLSLRDRYGLIWGLRVQEQFNAAVANAGFPQRLQWRGLAMQPPGDETRQRKLLELLRAILKRFGMGQDPTGFASADRAAGPAPPP